MAKPVLTVKVNRPTHLLDKQGRAITSSPAANIRDFVTTDTYVDDIANCLMLKPIWMPDNYPWGKDDYQLEPDTETSWIEAQDPLGTGGNAVGWAGPSSTPWYMGLNSSHLIGENRGIRMDFIWHRPADTDEPWIELFPRIDWTKTGSYGGNNYYFTPFFIIISGQSQLKLYEYPYDSYEKFEEDASTLHHEKHSYPVTVDPTQMGSKWFSIWFQPLSTDDVLIKSNLIYNGGFVYRSTAEHINVKMFPEGSVAFRSMYGGLSLCRVVPVEFPASGKAVSPFFEKDIADTRYPTLKVFGWGTSGYLDNTIVPAEGIGGISFRILDENDGEIPTGGASEFKKFKYEITLTSSNNVSPVIYDVICDFGESATTDDETTIDISNDVEITESSSSEFAGYKATVTLRNQDGKYNNLLIRPMLEIDYDIDGADRAVLYTLNPSFEWYSTPTKPALFLKWECGDGFEILNREFIENHPPYDGMKLSDALTALMHRVGFPDSLLDIDDTPDVYLPKKRGKDNYQFKPDETTTALDMLRTLHDWFRSEWICRFAADGKFEFKDPGAPAASRTFYLTRKAAYDAGATGYYVYGPSDVEIMHDQFYNEIWVFGYDSRTNRKLHYRWVEEGSQSDPNHPLYVGRRKLLVVITRINIKGYDTEGQPVGITWVGLELAKSLGIIRRRITFKSKVDPALRVQDFIKLEGVSHLWRLVDIGADATAQTTTMEGTIAGGTYTAIEWPQGI